MCWIHMFFAAVLGDRDDHGVFNTQNFTCLHMLQGKRQ